MPQNRPFYHFSLIVNLRNVFVGIWQKIGMSRHEFVCVRMSAHPGLSDTQKESVEFDYGMVNGLLEHQVRAALLPYFLRTMRIGPDDLTRDAIFQQIVLLNGEDLREYLRF